jgi:Tfp pilus assembly protein PilF
MQARGQASKIEPQVEDLAAKLLKKVEENETQDNDTQEAQLALAVGNLYTAVDLHEPAERWYRRLLKLVPERYEPLAMSLARQGRMDEAIQLCIKAAESEGNAAESDSSLQPVIVLTSVLTSGQPKAEDFKLAEPLLAEALKSHKDNPGLISAVASVRVVQGQTEAAIRLYRQVLQLRPKDALALNNLATLLAEQPETRKEALKYIDQAIEIAGEEPALLDTKGTILLSEDKPSKNELKDALTCLEKAAATPGADPRFHFHLAVAYDRASEAEKAGEAFAKALDGDLKDQILTETDRRWLAELEQKHSQ